MPDTSAPATSVPPSTTAFRPISLPPVLASMVAVEMASGFTQQYLSPLLAGLGEQAEITTAQQNWIYVIQTTSMAVLTPVLSRLGDSYGYRRVLRLSVGLVALGSLLMALWPNLSVLTLGAVMQGGVVGFMPLMIGILRNRGGEHASRVGIGVLVGALLLAVGFAGIISGAVGAGDARLGLWVGVAAGLLGVAACVLMPDAEGRRVGVRPFDVPGFLLLAVGLSGVVLALTQGSAWGWGSATTLGCGLVGLAALALWPKVELRVPHPLVDVRMFTNARIAVLSAVTFLVSFATIGSIAANATFLAASPDEAGYGTGLNSAAIGWALLPMTLASVASSLLTPAMLRIVGERITIGAAGVFTLVGFGGLAMWHSTLLDYLVLSSFAGLAMGIFESAARALTVEAVTEEDTATAAGVNELVLSLGVAVGAAVLGATLSAHADTGGQVAVGGYTTGWAVCAGAGLAAALVAVRLRPAPSRKAGVVEAG
ncbi:MFS transporter [Streptomyces sp. NPDC091267]|uniref:MFS transporter n=1 Tax=Streptomyces sp. NPDC091267 TaxID=3155195 RepID=UPI0034450A51